jgi:CRISPR-associated protein Csy1
MRRQASVLQHVNKLTHSKIDSPSIYDQISATKTEYITTSALTVKAIDGAVAGNQFAPIFQLLELECNGIKLAAELSNPKSDALELFSEENEYLEWNQGFGKALVSGSLASHLLAKQVYFSLNQSDSASEQYHLLCNVTSSSMAQAIFEGCFG